MTSRRTIALRSLDRKHQAFEMVLEGKNLTEIARKMDLSRRQVGVYYKQMIEDLKIDEIKFREWRIMVSYRLDLALKPLMKIITADDNGKYSTRDLADAIRAMVKVEERRARMLGLDKPTKIDVTHHIPTQNPEEAAERQRRRLTDAGFPKLVTTPPLLEAPVIDVEVEEEGLAEKA